MSLASRLPRRGMMFITYVFLTSIVGVQGAQASSGDAWQEFQQDVERACRAATKGVIDPQVVQVDPYGSESYGFAVLVGPEASTSKLRLVVCAYDKRTQVAEVSAAFDW